MNYFSEELKQKMDIPFDVIDEEMRDLVYIFNYIGLRTRWCCSGHGTKFPYIMFDEIIDESYTIVFEYIAELLPKSNINFWVRDTGEHGYGVLVNWVWRYPIYNGNEYLDIIELLVLKMAEHFNIPRE